MSWSQDPIACACATEQCLLVARESGVVQRYALSTAQISRYDEKIRKDTKRYEETVVTLRNGYNGHTKKEQGRRKKEEGKNLEIICSNKCRPKFFLSKAAFGVGGTIHHSLSSAGGGLGAARKYQPFLSLALQWHRPLGTQRVPQRQHWDRWLQPIARAQRCRWLTSMGCRSSFFGWRAILRFMNVHDYYNFIGCTSNFPNYELYMKLRWNCLGQGIHWVLAFLSCVGLCIEVLLLFDIEALKFWVSVFFQVSLTLKYWRSW